MKIGKRETTRTKPSKGLLGLSKHSEGSEAEVKAGHWVLSRTRPHRISTSKKLMECGGFSTKVRTTEV